MLSVDNEMTRTEYVNTRVPAHSVNSDMHLGGGFCSLYVREVIDAIAVKLWVGPGEDAK